MPETARRQMMAGALAGAVLAALVVGAAWSQTEEPALGDGAAGGASTHPLLVQTRERAAARDRGCRDCHGAIEPMHAVPGVHLACTDCHGGDETVGAAGAAPGSAEYDAAKRAAHVPPRHPERWYGDGGRSPSANPERSYTLLLEESEAFVRFVNPGDLRVAEGTCGPCHQAQVDAVRRSPMTTSSIFWAAAAYANGILPVKSALFGESYSAAGRAQRIDPETPPTAAERARGALDRLLPLPRWEVIQPGEYFRAFERGGILQPSAFPEIGNPNPLEDPGRPDIRLSNRGRGTGLRISPALINLHKTRLNDPHLSLLGTNDHPGDFRSSGCTACHVVYANDRDPAHSAGWADHGHLGATATADPTIPRGEPGHPIVHRFTRSIPSSQCMSCHLHQPNSFLNTYLGYTMWDYVTDGEALWPAEQRYPTAEERRAVLERNPEGAAPRGLWSDRDFLARVSELNPSLEHTRFADYHGHGWVFRAVYKRDREGRLLDAEGRVVPFDDPERFARAVHLKDIHLERGMHCVDCHFSRDTHGDGLVHGEYANAVEIDCVDCHGSVRAVSNLRTSGPSAPSGGTDLALGTTPFGQRRFAWRRTSVGERRLFQRSMLDPELEWQVPQVRHSVTAGHPGYNPRAARAKTLRRDGLTFGLAAGAGPDGLPPDCAALAHADERLACYTCHSSWVTSCSGCHLPQEANVKSRMQHYEGEETRNYASYNPQVIRTDAFMLGIHGRTKGGRVAPVRSSSALVLSSTNANRQRFYLQQPPISAPGYSSQAFNPHFPHTVRTAETRRCSDCHLSAEDDNNAWMAQLLLLGTNYVNFVGRFAWVGVGEAGVEAVGVTEWQEPQPVIGSYLHRLAFPDDYRRHRERELELDEAHHHSSRGEVRSLQLRGEYLFLAAGRDGLRVLDVANIDNKDFSERIVTAPVSPLGQRTRVATRDAAAVALPTTMPVAPWRETTRDYPENLERPMHPIYRFAFVADRQEGLVLVNVDTLTDGDPRNNFLEREPVYGQPAYNPDGLLTGARALAVAGNLVWVASDAGLVGVDFGRFGDPAGGRQPQPEVVAVVGELEEPSAVAVQFRYLFVTDRRGLATVDVTDPRRPRLAGRLLLPDARNVYVARTFAYVAAGGDGVAIVDVTRPARPELAELYDADGRLDDVWDVKVASTSSSLFAYVADGAHGLRVLQLTSPETTPGYLGFSPRPAPRLIATRHTRGPALALSKPLDRDRAVDESGNQVSVFNRIGARPFNLDEMRRLYLRDGVPYRVVDEPPPAGAGGGAP